MLSDPLVNTLDERSARKVEIFFVPELSTAGDNSRVGLTDLLNSQNG